MPTYIMLSTLTDEGRKTLKERPERIQEVNREIEAMGARVVQQYAVLGGYDFVNIIEAPDNDRGPGVGRAGGPRNGAIDHAGGHPCGRLHADAQGTRRHLTEKPAWPSTSFSRG